MLALVICGAAVLADDADAATTTYDATFYVDGDAYATVSFTEAGEAIALPTEPEKSGYTFAGWALTEDATEADVSAGTTTYETTDAADFSMYAVFDVEEYSVVYMVDGTIVGSTAGVTTGSAIDADGIIVPSKDHYTFLGWVDADGTMIVTYDYFSGSYVSGTWSISANTVLYASFQAETCTVTYMAGDDVVAVISVDYGSAAVPVALPDGYESWDFDFTSVVTEDTVIYAVESAPVETYTVTFVVDGTVIATYDSQTVTLPSDPSKEGYSFVGWYVDTTLVADPVTYSKSVTADTAFTATFIAVSVEYCTVTFTDGTVVTEVSVVKGEVIDEVPEVSEGMQWDPAVDLTAPVEEDMAVGSVPEKVTVTFVVGSTVVSALGSTIDYGSVYDTSKLNGYILPSGYTGWDFDFTQAIYADTSIYAIEAEAEPAFWETSTGQIAIFLVILLVCGFIYAYWNNLFGLKDLLSRKGKEE